MTKLSQLIERNRRHSDTPYILLLECALPNGVTLRFARDTQSWVWPLTGSVHGDLTYPGHSLEFAAGDAGLTLCVLGKWRGHVGLDARQADGSWSEVVSYTQRVEESHDVPPGAYRLCAREDFRAKAACHLGPLSMPLWQSMAFDFDEFAALYRSTVGMGVA